MFTRFSAVLGFLLSFVSASVIAQTPEQEAALLYQKAMNSPIFAAKKNEPNLYYMCDRLRLLDEAEQKLGTKTSKILYAKITTHEQFILRINRYVYPSTTKDTKDGVLIFYPELYYTIFTSCLQDCNDFLKICTNKDSVEDVTNIRFLVTENYQYQRLDLIDKYKRGAHDTIANSWGLKSKRSEDNALMVLNTVVPADKDEMIRALFPPFSINPLPKLKLLTVERIYPFISHFNRINVALMIIDSYEQTCKFKEAAELLSKEFFTLPMTPAEVHYHITACNYFSGQHEKNYELQGAEFILYRVGNEDIYNKWTYFQFLSYFEHFKEDAVKQLLSFKKEDKLLRYFLAQEMMTHLESTQHKSFGKYVRKYKKEVSKQRKKNPEDHILTWNSVYTLHYSKDKYLTKAIKDLSSKKDPDHYHLAIYFALKKDKANAKKHYNQLKENSKLDCRTKTLLQRLDMLAGFAQ